MKRSALLGIVGGFACAITLAVVAISLIAARSAPITSATIVRTRDTNSLSSMPFSHIVKDVSKAQRLYDAVRALPAPTGDGIINCPLDLDISYQMTFRSASGVQLTVTLEGSGCRFLYIGDRGYTTDAAFWQLLAITFGVSEGQFLPVPPR